MCFKSCKPRYKVFLLSFADSLNENCKLAASTLTLGNNIAFNHQEFQKKMTSTTSLQIHLIISKKQTYEIFKTGPGDSMLAIKRGAWAIVRGFDSSTIWVWVGMTSAVSRFSLFDKSSLGHSPFKFSP